MGHGCCGDSGCCAEEHTLWKAWKTLELPPFRQSCPQHHLSSGILSAGRRKGKRFGQAAAQGSGVAQAEAEHTWLCREGGCQPRLEEHVLPRHRGTRAKGNESTKAINFGCCQKGPGSGLVPYIKTQVRPLLASGSRCRHELLLFQPLISFRRGEMET